MAALRPPDNIEPLLRVLQAQGHTLVSPRERRGLHPLLIPLACSEQPDTATANAALTSPEVYTCLLRWPEPHSDSLPLVRASRNAPSVMHVARSVDEYLHRCRRKTYEVLFLCCCLVRACMCFARRARALSVGLTTTVRRPEHGPEARGSPPSTSSTTNGHAAQHPAGVYRSQEGIDESKQTRGTDPVTLRRALAEEDARNGSDGSVAAAAGEAGASVYTPGGYSDSGLATLEAYLTRRAGMFVDVVEQLVSLHLQKGDQMSALITGEWCAPATWSAFPCPAVKGPFLQNLNALDMQIQKGDDNRIACSAEQRQELLF